MASVPALVSAAAAIGVALICAGLLAGLIATGVDSYQAYTAKDPEQAWERGTEAVSNGILTALAAIFAPRAIGSLLGVEGAGAAGAGAEGAGIAVEKGTEAGVGAPLDSSTFRNAQLRRLSTIYCVTWVFDMKNFDEDDVSIEHAKLIDGGGYLRLTHRPSGLSVEARSTSTPILKIKKTLMDELRGKVLGAGVGRADEALETC